MLISIAIGSGVLAASVAFSKKRKNSPLIALLDDNQTTGLIDQRQSKLHYLTTEVSNQFIAAGDSYQRFVQTRIDPLLGQERYTQSQEMLNDEALTLSEDERSANFYFALGTLTLGISIIGRWVLTPLMPVAIALGLASTAVNYYEGWQLWRKGKPLGNIHLLCIYVTFMWLGGYALVGALGIALWGVGLKAKAMTEKQSSNNLIDIFQLQPVKVWTRSNGTEIETPFEQLQIGDTLVLQAGQIVPVDGTIVAGVATVDQHMLTGEAQPVEKSVGEPVLASTILISGKVDICVAKTGRETTAGQIGEILNQSAQYNTSTSVKGLEIGDRFALPTLTLSAVSWPLIGPAGAISLLGANSTINTYFTGPLAVLNFLNLAASSGILVKDGGALEQLNGVSAVVFDKTGTLTLEQPHVAQVHTLGQMDVEGVLTLAAAAEARQTHPIARAILDAAKDRALQLPAIDQAHYEVGYGLRVRFVKPSVISESAINGSVISESAPLHVSHPSPLIRVGSGRFMAMEGVVLPDEVATLTEACQNQGHSLVMVAVDDELVGCIELQPTVRPEAHQIVAGLRDRGLALFIISGDQEAPTKKLAEELGMTGYFANTLPEAKADLVAKLQAEGHTVCFIGDGINDAIAMRKAEVSISLRGATTAATDTAQVILMEGNLNRLLYLFQLSEEFERNLKRNFQFTVGVSSLATAGILFAGFTFVATEIFYTVSLLGGIGIAMRPLLDHRRKW